MNCEICKVRPAKVHYTEIVNNQMTKMNLCLECAEEKGVDVQKAGNFGLGDLVAGLIDTAVDADAERISKVHCPRCGYQYSAVSYTHLRAHETGRNLVCRLL